MNCFKQKRCRKVPIKIYWKMMRTWQVPLPGSSHSAVLKHNEAHWDTLRHNEAHWRLYRFCKIAIYLQVYFLPFLTRIKTICFLWNMSQSNSPFHNISCVDTWQQNTCGDSAIVINKRLGQPTIEPDLTVSWHYYHSLTVFPSCDPPDAYVIDPGIHDDLLSSPTAQDGLWLTVIDRDLPWFTVIGRIEKCHNFASGHVIACHGKFEKQLFSGIDKIYWDGAGDAD